MAILLLILLLDTLYFLKLIRTFSLCILVYESLASYMYYKSLTPVCSL